MKRTTVSLPDDLARAVEREARRRRIPVSQLAREAFEARLGRSSGRPREIPFAALGRSEHRSTARDIDTILEAEWGQPDRPGGGDGARSSTPRGRPNPT